MARPTARPAAVSRAESPALRPRLTGTRRRKRRRGPSARRSTGVARRRGANEPDDQITPSCAEQPHPLGPRRSGVAARAQRAHTRPEQPTTARAVEGGVKGHGHTEARGPRPNACARASSEARRSVAPHLPTRAETLLPRGGPRLSPVRTKNLIGRLSACRARRMRAAFMGGSSGKRGAVVQGRTRRGGSHGVRGSAWELNPRAWQRVRRRRCAALGHSARG